MKYVYSFKDGKGSMRDVLGGKGANLCEMSRLGIPVPNGFIVTTRACQSFYKSNMNINQSIEKEIDKKIKVLEKETGKVFGSKTNPLLVSVRSGARVSMPGMMDTILNLGLNDEIVSSLSRKLDKRFVYDCYRRFISMYSDVVMGFDKSLFENIIDDLKKRKKIKYDTDLTFQDMVYLVDEFKKLYKDLANEDFPSSPRIQLMKGIKAVFKSWNNERAKFYRKMNNIPDDWGTAVNVQEMVYGNLNDNSGSGVIFSRNPSTGENVLYGEFLMNAQGEDIVAGVRTPKKIEELKMINPKCYQELLKISKLLERHFKDMQDMEFTIENDKLYMLQTRNGKRTGQAVIKIAIDLMKDGLITKRDVIKRISTSDINSVLHKTFDQNDLEGKDVITRGLAASPGAGVGRLYFNANDVKKAYKDGERDIVLVRYETSPEDIEGMNLSKAVFTVRGGMTSHAAVVARGMGIPCVCGCEDVEVSDTKKILVYKNKKLKEGDLVSVDGSSGTVYLGEVKITESGINDSFKELMKVIKEYMKIDVRANADNYRDAKKALELGARGIGLCRTEHMFFDKERILNFRKVILSESKEEREESLSKILPYQENDFYELFKVMNGYPVTIRLLDPPLHEFLPKDEKEKKDLSKKLGISIKEINLRIDELKEFNPMMGHRGCRLMITYPEIIEMQTNAIMRAVIKAKEEKVVIKPEIMVPLVGEEQELIYVKEVIKKTIDSYNEDIDIKIGTMIEVPRGALVADKIAKHADFFSFGTNDLTQMTYGYSRDDAGKFLDDYLNKKILTFNPFEKLDQRGVGLLIKEAIKRGKYINKNIELGICGEQGADEDSIKFLIEIGIDYVSCSPYRVPCAMLTSAKYGIIK